MKKLGLTVIVFLFSLHMVQAQISYKVLLNDPQMRYATVEIEVMNHKKPELKFKMPVWTPGSYMIREFARNVESFVAYDANGSELVSYKEDKNTWVVKNNKTLSFSVSYRVYANEVSVRTTFINNETAFLSGTSLFMYADGYAHLPGKVKIEKPERWTQIATGLKAIDDEPNTFAYDDYDELADCPIQVGDFKVLSFEVKGIPHHVALVGHSNVQEAQLITDLKKVCETTASVVNRFDFDSYWFFVHHVDQGGGGLEHRNSTAVVMPRWNYSNTEQYQGFLRLCAHEYFHTWNIKRIRPIELGPFDYDKEVYSQQLWVAEGITSYYDKLIMLRAGFTTPEAFLGTLGGNIGYAENTPGAKVQSLAMSSMDAWIKFYRPDENSVNSSISYYTKGAVAAAFLDLTIRTETNGQKSLDDLLIYLYDTYYVKRKRGFTVAEFNQAASLIAGKNLNDLMHQLIYTTQTPDYASLYSNFGVTYKTVPQQTPFIGVNASEQNGQHVVSSVLVNSSAFVAGLTKGDVVLSINGMKPVGDLNSFLQQFDIGSSLKVLVIRGGVTLNFELILTKNPYPKHILEKNTDLGPRQEKLYNHWLMHSY